MQSLSKYQGKQADYNEQTDQEYDTDRATNEL